MRKQRIGHLMTLWLVIGGVLSGCATFEKCGFTGCPGDAEITAEVKALYAEHPELGTSITVQTLDHVVYLYGLVNTAKHGERGARTDWCSCCVWFTRSGRRRARREAPQRHTHRPWSQITNAGFKIAGAWQDRPLMRVSRRPDAFSPGTSDITVRTRSVICHCRRSTSIWAGRAAEMRRTTIKAVSQKLSAFLRFLHQCGHVPFDLSGRMIRPTLYEFESIPSILRPDEIKQILQVTRRDRSARGRRDYAILTLLATYGLRAGEIVHLQLRDIDWRAETILIRHSKIRGTTLLPLVPAAGDALLSYLRSGRPKTTAREVFIRMSAPLQGFSRGNSLHALVRRRIAAAGVRPVGKRGPHVFRHAHAVGLLRATVPMKTISDLLGHRSSRSTAIYLKLDSEELRAVALPLPTAEGAR